MRLTSRPTAHTSPVLAVLSCRTRATPTPTTKSPSTASVQAVDFPTSTLSQNTSKPRLRTTSRRTRLHSQPTRPCTTLQATTAAALAPTAECTTVLAGTWRCIFSGSSWCLADSCSRAYPDFGASGDGIVVVTNGNLIIEGGTSASAPIFAAILTRINEERLLANKSTIGFVNPTLVSPRSLGLSDFLELTKKIVCPPRGSPRYHARKQQCLQREWIQVRRRGMLLISYYFNFEVLY